MYQILWVDRRGAGHIRTLLTLDDAALFASKLKHSARITRNHVDIGEVFKREGKWLWVIEE